MDEATLDWIDWPTKMIGDEIVRDVRGTALVSIGKGARNVSNF